MVKKDAFLKNLLQLNLAMILVSTSGIMGRSIPLWPPVAIAYRALIAAGLLFLFLKFKGIDLYIHKKDRGMIFLGGILIGLHWITYFEALQLSSVAIGMLTIFTYPVITSILEPLVLRTPFEKIHVILALLVLVGVSFLVPDLNIHSAQTQAVGFGLLSALLYSLRNILMKKQIDNYHGSKLMWYQMIVVALILAPFYFMVTPVQFMAALPYLTWLALVTTALGHTLFLMSFKYFEVTTASIISSMQPLYGILMAFLFLGESPPWQAFIGGVLIVFASLTESLRTYLRGHRQKK